MCMLWLFIFYPSTVASNVIFTNPLIREHCSTAANVIVSNPLICQHCTGSIHVVPATIYLFPACYHPSGIIEVIPSSINEFPAVCLTTTVSMSVPPTATGFHPTRCFHCLCPCSRTVYPVVSYPLIRKHCAITVHVIPFTIDELPSGFHRAVICSTEIEPVVSDFLPAVKHCSTATHIVPFAFYSYPASSHPTVIVHEIPLTVHILPACLHRTVFFTAEVIPTTTVPVPTIVHITSSVKVI